jgi:hypothetical protein
MWLNGPRAVFNGKTLDDRIFYPQSLASVGKSDELPRLVPEQTLGRNRQVYDISQPGVMFLIISEFLRFDANV